jgi:hypothetical protein
MQRQRWYGSLLFARDWKVFREFARQFLAQFGHSGCFVSR